MRTGIEGMDVADLFTGPRVRYRNIRQTLSGTLTLDDGPALLFLNPTGADRTVLLPPEVNGGRFIVVNTGVSGFNLTVKEDSNTTTIGVVPQGGALQFFCDGTTWFANNAASGTGTLVVGSDLTDRVTIKGIYRNPAPISVAIPSIVNDVAENIDSVAVDVSTAFSIQPAVGDAVIPIPLAALPTDCLLLSAYVTATDQITVTVGSREGGAGVTGANVNFNFLVIDLT